MIFDSNMRNIPIKTRMANFLRKYRNTPSTVTGKTPAELILSFRSRTVFDIINNKSVPSNVAYPSVYSVNKKIEQSNGNCNKNQNLFCDRSRIDCKPVDYQVGEVVSFQNVYQNYINWKPAEIVKKISKSIYLVNLSGIIRKAHIRQ